jgi:hypothetical protein
MFRKLFSASLLEDEQDEMRSTPPSRGLDLSESDDQGPAQNSGRAPLPEPSAPNATFDEIYRKASTKLPRTSWGIPKLREMADSPHLAGMNTESKRGAILMALDAAGAKIEDILQDAVLRQRALNEYEEKEENRLHESEAEKTGHNRAIQAELDRFTATSMGRIQANVDEIARQQDEFHVWQKRKTDESECLADAAALLIPQGSGVGHGTNSSLSNVLERASAARGARA